MLLVLVLELSPIASVMLRWSIYMFLCSPSEAQALHQPQYYQSTLSLPSASPSSFIKAHNTSRSSNLPECKTVPACAFYFLCSLTPSHDPTVTQIK